VILLIENFLELMMFKPIITLALLLQLAGCTSLIATATGPKPLGQPEGDRTLSMRMQDSGITTTAEVNIYKANPKFRDANVNVVAFYGSVLLAGQVPSEDMKAQAEKVVNEIAEVKHVNNQLTVADTSYYLDRSKDGIISTKIRSAFLFDQKFPSSRTKVLTVGGTVYLMGKLTNAEATQAVDMIKQVAGVTKIVKLVDYLQDSSSSTDNTPAPAPASAPVSTP
jgi:osmotically-inducible protein OsmY